MNGFFIGLDWQHQPTHDLDPRACDAGGASQCAAGEVIVNQGVPNNKRQNSTTENNKLDLSVHQPTMPFENRLMQRSM